MKTQFCLISSLCRDQSLGPSIPPPLPKNPSPRTMHKRSQLHFRNKSALFTDKYLFSYLPRKHERQIQYLYFQYHSLGNITKYTQTQASEDSFEIPPKFACANQLVPPPSLEIKGEILIYSGGHLISAGWTSQPSAQLLRKALRCYDSEKKQNNEFTSPVGKTQYGGDLGVPPPGASIGDSQLFPFTKDIPFLLFFLILGELLISDLCWLVRDKDWSA